MLIHNHTFRQKSIRSLVATVTLISGSLSGCGRLGHTTRQPLVEQGLMPAVVLEGRPCPSWQLQDRMARYSVPALSIAVINRGELDWAAAFGVRQAGTTDPVSTSTLFQAASISKPVTALGALKLVQEGRLDIDADINTQLRSWKIPPNQYMAHAPVTLKLLLSHGGGVNVNGYAGYTHSEPMPSLLQILDGVTPANSPPVRVNAVPGSSYRYSGGGYEIVELAIQDATGMSFPEAMQQLVLTPCGMTRSCFVQQLPDSWATDAADGHSYAGTPMAGRWRNYPELAAAGLWTTPADLAKFGMMLMRAYHGASDAGIDSETVRLMMSKTMGDMGLGLGVHGEASSLHADHGGWNSGFRTYMVLYPAIGAGVVVMANGDGGDLLIQETVRSVANVYGWPGFAPLQRAVASLDAAKMAERAGQYAVRDYGFTITIECETDHLTASTPRGSRYTFYPLSESEYFAIEDGSSLTFSQASNGTTALHIWGMSADRLATE